MRDRWHPLVPVPTFYHVDLFAFSCTCHQLTCTSYLHPDFCTCAGNDGGDGQKDGGDTADADDEDEHLEVHNSDSVFTKVCRPFCAHSMARVAFVSTNTTLVISVFA